MQIAGCLVLAACTRGFSEPEGEGLLVVSTDRLSYRTGDTVVVEFSNRGANELQFTCLAVLQKRRALHFEVEPTFDPRCSVLDIRYLPPDSTVEVARYALTGELTAGSYRMFFGRAWDDAGYLLPIAQRTTPEFAVVGAGE